ISFFCLFFFFSSRRRHTRSLRDWSSDVCSSDLGLLGQFLLGDFGMAKATQQELTEKTIVTQFHHFIGTPAYISPEQALMTSLDKIGRASCRERGEEWVGEGVVEERRRSVGREGR